MPNAIDETMASAMSRPIANAMVQNQRWADTTDTAGTAGTAATAGTAGTAGAAGTADTAVPER